ncbi:alpha/beta fold hydrolase BchO [Sulfitobacter sp. JB4-11]|uniref:alpha/beta fold hydrolase BchO n=1 Tax=Sulfitobacter rhodophyticola TaxID=3238304 RepID=UPI0035143CE4
MNLRDCPADWPMADASRMIDCRPHRWHVQEMGDGPLLLLIHGAGGATQSWRHLMPLLARTHRVVAMDLPGQGMTRMGARQRCGLHHMAEDITALCTQEGWEPEAIIGHSAGAAIALQMTLAKGAPPVVGLNAALGNFKGLAGLLFPMMAKALALTPMVARIFTASAAQPASVRRLIEGTGSTLRDEDLRWYRRLVSDRDHVDGTLAMMSQWNLTPLLRALPRHHARALLITGARDRAVPPSTSAEVAARMPDAEHITLPDLGHLAHEENAAAVLAPILDFLHEENA